MSIFLKDHRKRNDLTQEQLADKADTTTNVIKRAEAGTELKFEVAKSVANVFNLICADDLYLPPDCEESLTYQFKKLQNKPSILNKKKIIIEISVSED